MDPQILFLIATLAKIIFVLLVIGLYAPVLTWAERRESAMMQDRVGPVRAGIVLPPGVVEVIRFARYGAYAVAVGSGVYGLFAIGANLFLSEPPMPMWHGWAGLVAFAFHWIAGSALRILVPDSGNVTVFGLLHPLADVLKMVWKEDFIPPKADKFLHSIAPILAMTPAFATFAVIPFGDVLYPDLLLERVPASGSFAGHYEAIPLQVASLNVGILYIFAIAGTGVVGAAIAGYSSDNKFSLLGGLRAAGQMVSYEVTLGLSLVGCFMVYGSLRLEDMVHWQMHHAWGIFVQPLAFILFFTAAVAETKRIPFDVPEGESELVGGYFTEYSGMKFGMFMTGEFVEIITSSALVITLFLGGYDLPFLSSAGFNVFGFEVGLQHWAVVLIQILTFLIKLALMIWLQFIIRWSLPRFRYDQIMKLCWQVLLPLSLVNILLTGIGILALSE